MSAFASIIMSSFLYICWLFSYFKEFEEKCIINSKTTKIFSGWKSMSKYMYAFCCQPRAKNVKIYRIRMYMYIYNYGDGKLWSSNEVLLVNKQGHTSMASEHWHSGCYELSYQYNISSVGTCIFSHVVVRYVSNGPATGKQLGGGMEITCSLVFSCSRKVKINHLKELLENNNPK